MNSSSPSSSVLTRRQFLATSAIATSALCVGGALFPRTVLAASPKRRLIPLDGAWQVARSGTSDWIPATVPGCIHTDLLAAGKIPDPFYRDNEKSVQWIGDTDWLYRRTFEVDAEMLSRRQVMLRCEGVDTLATIRVNGQEVGKTDNMFRIWEFEVKPLLKPGENQIEVLISSPEAFVQALQARQRENNGVSGRSWLRKQPCQFGWDWAPKLVTSGIWRNISLQVTDHARLENVTILQDHSVKNRVELTIHVEAQQIQSAALSADVTVTYQGNKAGSGTAVLSDGKGAVAVTIRNPKLWWPNGMGGQPLYMVNVNLLDENGRTIDTVSKRTGLRTLKLLEKDDQNPLHFEVNGIPFFAKGANWIPSDSFATRVTTERLRRYAADAAAVNMNMLRFWGGGYYEEDALYDACDEMGICVWVDFKFACASYPAFDGGFMENVRMEARDNLKRLHHHPCIAVWCGNNEITYLVRDSWGPNFMAREGYKKLFKDLLGEQVKELSPQTSYVSGSPDCGDVHYWDVWWGDKIFDSYRKLSGFMSEFGYQSYPEPKSVCAYTSEEDRTSTFTPIMKWHERADTGNLRIQNMTGNYFRKPKDFDSTIWISQIVQGCGIKTGAEAWRRDMPKSMGCLFWQYNDCWPAASWASVDYYGRWKALHYAARHFYAPVMVSGLEDTKAKTVDLFVTSDNATACQGTVEWNITDLQGTLLDSGKLDAAIPARMSQKIKTLELDPLCQMHGENNLLIWLKLSVDGRRVSQNLVTFARPKDINLADPLLTTTVTRTKAGFCVKVAAAKPAMWVWLNLSGVDARYSDNFVHLNAHEPVELVVTPARPMSAAEFETALTVSSLYDTYSHAG